MQCQTGWHPALPKLYLVAWRGSSTPKPDDFWQERAFPKRVSENSNPMVGAEVTRLQLLRKPPGLAVEEMSLTSAVNANTKNLCLACLVLLPNLPDQTQVKLSKRRRYERR